MNHINPNIWLDELTGWGYVYTNQFGSIKLCPIDHPDLIKACSKTVWEPKRVKELEEWL